MPGLLELPDNVATTYFDSYRRTYVERDLRELSVITGLSDYRRLMRVVCLRIGQLVDVPNVGVTAILPLDIFD